MQILLIVLAVVLGLAALVLVLALFAKKEYRVSRSITIQKTAPEVYEYVRRLKNHDRFNKWTMHDPDMKRTYGGTDGTVGFVYAWDGNKRAGKGEQEITALRQNERVEMEIRFERPFKAVSRGNLDLTPQSATQTRVTWTFDSQMNYPMNVLLLFMDMDKVLGADMETSLLTLKQNLEA